MSICINNDPRTIYEKYFMPNDLLNYYLQELRDVRELIEKFSAAHPQIANRLGLGKHKFEEPEIARLFESFALLNARTRSQLADEYPEIYEPLLSILLPHLHAPIPMMSIAKVEFDATKLMREKIIPAQTLLNVQQNSEENYFFTTCYPVHLLPLKINRAKFQSQPFLAPVIKLSPIAAILQLSLEFTHEKLSFIDVPFDDLNFYINLQPEIAYALYTMLFQYTLTMVIAAHAQDEHPIILNAQDLASVGFHKNSDLLPYPSNLAKAYRLLNEFFLLPEKFLFFSINNLRDKIANKFGDKGKSFEIFFYFSKSHKDLEQHINASSFALGCTPIINLFPKTTYQTLTLTPYVEQRLQADLQPNNNTQEIYQVKNITAHISGLPSIPCQSIYALYKKMSEKQLLRYKLVRKPAWLSGKYARHGTELLLSFVHKDLASKENEFCDLQLDLLCINRYSPNYLGGNTANLLFYTVEIKLDSIKSIKALKPLSPTYYPLLRKEKAWLMIKNLATNRVNALPTRDAIQQLKDILGIYDFLNKDTIKLIIDSLLELYVNKKMIRKNANQYGDIFWWGLEINLVIDKHKCDNDSIFLLGEILAYFFSLYTTSAYFTQLVIYDKAHELYRWAPRAGVGNCI